MSLPPKVSARLHSCMARSSKARTRSPRSCKSGRTTTGTTVWRSSRPNTPANASGRKPETQTVVALRQLHMPSRSSNPTSAGTVDANGRLRQPQRRMETHSGSPRQPRGLTRGLKASVSKHRQLDCDEPLLRLRAEQHVGRATNKQGADASRHRHPTATGDSTPRKDIPDEAASSSRPQ